MTSAESVTSVTIPCPPYVQPHLPDRFWVFMRGSGYFYLRKHDKNYIQHKKEPAGVSGYYHRLKND
jgi:hypothetical protein